MIFPLQFKLDNNFILQIVISLEFELDSVLFDTKEMIISYYLKHWYILSLYSRTSL